MCYMVDTTSPSTVHLRLGMCYVLVLMELQHICGMDTQGDKSLLDAWTEMRRKLSSHSAQAQLYMYNGQVTWRKELNKERVVTCYCQ